MTIEYERLAVAWVPPAGSRLAERGAMWTGWCPEMGPPVGLTQAVGADVAASCLRRRGLHAPVIRPFVLQRSVSIWHLCQALAEEVLNTRVMEGVRLTLTVKEGRVALVPVWPMPGWSQMAARLARVVFDVSPGSVPLGTGSMFLRLTDPLPDARVDGAEVRALRHFTPALDQLLAISELVLLGVQGAGEPWQVIDRYPLSGEACMRSSPPEMACEGPNLISPLSDQLVN